METKLCDGKHGCGRLLPVSKFGRYNNYWANYRNVCRECESIDSSRRYQKKHGDAINAKRIARANEKTRVCKSCSIEYPIEEFAVSGRHKINGEPCTYRKANCKKCHRWWTNNVAGEAWRKPYNDMIRDTLHDVYIKAMLRNMDIIDPSPEIINAKRLQIMLFRETKNKKNEQRQKVSN